MRYALLIAGFAGLLAAGSARAEDDAAAGHTIVKENCSPCHAVESTDDSPDTDAPPFRTFKEKWPLENLEEALAEGIVVGHEGIDMPEFVFEPEQITDIIAYLGTLKNE
jgi:mono/diheme cytochrome c family protein